MKRFPLFALAVVILLLAATACGGSKPSAAEPKTAAQPAAQSKTDSKPSAQPAAEKATPTEEVSADEPTAEPEATEPAAEPTAADDSLSIESRAAGLDKLKSYRMKWLAEWKGTDNGKDESGSWNWVEEYSSDPKGLHWIWDIADSSDANKNTGMEMWQIDNASYMQTKDADGKAQCMSFSSDDQSNQLTKGIFSPDSLGRVEDAKYVGTEDVNGIKAKHYKYDNKGVTLAGMGQVTGEMWVAVDGGYIVKDTVSWKGTAGLFGLGSSTSQGDGKWTWELSDVDKPIDLKVPENCASAASDLPIMADAKEKSQFGDMISYTTGGKMADVAAFYKDKMKAAGWAEEEGGLSMDEMASLSFTKDTQKASVMITTSDGKTSVVVTVSK
jgi:hypothetical protein